MNTSCRKPRGVALDHRRLRIDLHAHVLGPGRLDQRRGGVSGNVTEVERQAIERDRARIGSGEQQQVVDERREVLDLRADVLERVARRS